MTRRTIESLFVYRIPDGKAKSKCLNDGNMKDYERRYERWHNHFIHSWNRTRGEIFTRVKFTFWEKRMIMFWEEMRHNDIPSQSRIKSTGEEVSEHEIMHDRESSSSEIINIQEDELIQASSWQEVKEIPFENHQHHCHNSLSLSFSLGA